MINNSACLTKNNIMRNIEFIINYVYEESFKTLKG